MWRHYRVLRPRFRIRFRNFGDSAINKGQIAYFFIAYTRNGYIYTSGQKSDVTIVRFFTKREDFGDTWTFNAVIELFIFALIFRTSGSEMGIFREKIGKWWGDIDPHRTRSYFWVFTPLCPISWKSTNKMRPWEWRHMDRQTHTQTDRRKLILLSLPCYSYGAD